MRKLIVRWAIVVLSLLPGLACSEGNILGTDAPQVGQDTQSAKDTQSAGDTQSGGDTSVGVDATGDTTRPADATGDAQTQPPDTGPDDATASQDSTSPDTEPACVPSTEVCDGVDNNCDTIVDEGCECIDFETRDCGTGADGCHRGTATCVDGKWGACEGADLSCGTCGGCPSGKVCNNRGDCVDPGQPCQNRCDCQPGHHCAGDGSGGWVCVGGTIGPFAPKCCTDTLCASGERCVTLSGESSTCS